MRAQVDAKKVFEELCLLHPENAIVSCHGPTASLKYLGVPLPIRPVVGPSAALKFLLTPRISHLHHIEAFAACVLYATQYGICVAIDNAISFLRVAPRLRAGTHDEIGSIPCTHLCKQPVPH